MDDQVLFSFIAVPMQRNYSQQERPEIPGMIPHPGIGVASYINSMNKDRRRKSSAPLLLSPFEPDGGDISRADSTSSSESVGIVMQERERAATSSPNLSSIFHFQKATPVNLNAISPMLKEESVDAPDIVTNKTDDEKPTLKNRKLRQTISADDVVKADGPKRKNGDRQFMIDVKNVSPNSNMIDEGAKSSDESNAGKEPPHFIEMKEQRKTPRKKFAVTNISSKSRLLGNSPESYGSEESLSNVVGKLKEKEVFL